MISFCRVIENVEQVNTSFGQIDFPWDPHVAVRYGFQEEDLLRFKVKQRARTIEKGKGRQIVQTRSRPELRTLAKPRHGLYQ